MSWFEIIAERKIRDAQEEGAFDNLPGKGQPLNLEQDPRVPPEQRAAYRLMREAKILPDWIQIDKEIRQRLVQWEVRVDQYAQGREEDLRRSQLSHRPTPDAIDRLREKFLLQAAQHLKETNRQIERLNLIVPGHGQQRLRLPLEERMETLEERFPRLTPYAAGQEAEWRKLLEERRRALPNLTNRMPQRRRRDSIG